MIGAASGRGWIGFAAANRPMVLAAVQGSGAKLSVVTTTSVPAQNGLILGSELLYHPPHISGKGGELGSVPLLANGRVGASGPVPGDPESKVSQEYGPRVFNAIRIGARTVWLIGGGESRGISSFKPRLWACCTETGEARELTSPVLARTPNAHSAQLGLDAAGKLWLAWSNPARMVELDPATLAPRTAPSVIPGGTPDKLTLLCDVACRVVEYDSGTTAGIFSWAPGERSRTRIVRPTRRGLHTIVPALLAASYRAGGLTVAYALAGGNPMTGASLVRVVRGDARGSRGRVVGSTEIPWSDPACSPQHGAERRLPQRGATRRSSPPASSPSGCTKELRAPSRSAPSFHSPASHLSRFPVLVLRRGLPAPRATHLTQARLGADRRPRPVQVGLASRPEQKPTPSVFADENHDGPPLAVPPLPRG